MEVTIVGCRPTEPLSALPARLLHRENAEFLIGQRAFGLGDGSAVLEEALQRYSKDLALEEIAAGKFGRYTRSLKIQVTIDEDGRSVDVGHGLYELGRSDTWELSGTRVGLVVRGQKTPPHLSIVTVSLYPLLSWWPDLRGSYSVYSHRFLDVGESGWTAEGADRNLIYVGITKQGWAKRWGQHRGNASAGSPYLFHRAIRDHGTTSTDLHEVVCAGLSQDEAMAMEELLVARASLYPRGLNMIPGGYAGLRYLAQHNVHVHPNSWEKRDRIVGRFMRQSAADGKPNPLAAALWKDDDYASKIICSNPNNFKRAAVSDIRYLASLGHPTRLIAERHGAREERIERLLKGATYGRVH